MIATLQTSHAGVEGSAVRSSTLGAIIVAVLVALGLTTSARAQGTSGTFPSPINSQQLESYADRLALSEPQRIAIQAEHDEYRRQFRILRDGAIAAFLQKQQGMQGGIPQRDAVERLLDELAQVENAITVVDNGLFDRVMPILTDEQRAMLPRVRLSRERARYADAARSAGDFQPGKQADLSELHRRVDAQLPVSAEIGIAADAMLVTYERRLTTVMRKLNEALTRMTLDMMDLLAERGFQDITQEELLADPELLQKVIKEISDAYIDLQANTAELSTDLRKLNHSTYRQLAGMLPELNARALRDMYFETAYPELASVVAMSKNEWMTPALNLATLNDDQRAVIEPVAAAYRHTMDLAINESFASVEAFWCEFSPFNVDQSGATTLQEELIEQLSLVGTARDEAQLALEAALGAEMVSELRTAAAELMARVPERPQRSPLASASIRGRLDGVAGDPFLPAPINASDLAALARRLDLDDDAEGVIEVLHGDYRDAVAEQPVFGRLRTARLEQQRSIGTAEVADAEAAIARVVALRREALDAVIVLDRDFFEAVKSVRGDDEQPWLDRVAGMRRREAYTGSGGAGLVLGRDVSYESRVDMLAVLFDAQIPQSELEPLGSILDAYEEQAIDALRAGFEARLAMQKMTDSWTAGLTRATREDLSSVVAMQIRYRDAMKGPAERVRESNESVAALNRRTLERIESSLGEEHAFGLRSVYERQAFPAAFDDPAAVLDHVSTALALTDLSMPQRNELMQLAGEYRPEYDRLTRLMIEASATGGLNVVGADADSLAEWQRHQQEVTRLRFDRNELNVRAISRLKSILTEAQRIAIGGLPEPLGEDEFFLFR